MQLSYIVCFWHEKQIFGQRKDFKLIVPSSVSTEQLSALISFWACKNPQLPEWCRPLSAPFCYGSVAWLFDELSQLADQNAAQSASPATARCLTLFSHCLSHSSDLAAVQLPFLCCLIPFLSNQPDRQFDYLLLPLTLLAFLLLPAVPWPARNSPSIPSDPPLVLLADRLYTFPPSSSSMISC